MVATLAALDGLPCGATEANRLVYVTAESVFFLCDGAKWLRLGAQRPTDEIAASLHGTWKAEYIAHSGANYKNWRITVNFDAPAKQALVEIESCYTTSNCDSLGSWSSDEKPFAFSLRPSASGFHELDLVSTGSRLYTLASLVNGILSIGIEDFDKILEGAPTPAQRQDFAKTLVLTRTAN